MAEKAQLEEAAKGELEAAGEKKGIQSVTVSATVDPSAYVQFKVREDLIKHFGITLIPSSIADGDKLFIAKTKVSGTSTNHPTTLGSAGAGTVKSNRGKLIGRAIKIPTGGGYQRKVKGKDTDIKKVTIRVPSLMSLPAIVLWINSAFSQENKKPVYFITPAGARVSIDSSFTDKSKLANKKNE